MIKVKKIAITQIKIIFNRKVKKGGIRIIGIKRAISKFKYKYKVLKFRKNKIIIYKLINNQIII